MEPTRRLAVGGTFAVGRASGSVGPLRVPPAASAHFSAENLAHPLVGDAKLDRHFALVFDLGLGPNRILSLFPCLGLVAVDPGHRLLVALLGRMEGHDGLPSGKQRRHCRSAVIALYSAGQAIRPHVVFIGSSEAQV